LVGREGIIIKSIFEKIGFSKLHKNYFLNKIVWFFIQYYFSNCSTYKSIRVIKKLMIYKIYFILCFDNFDMKYKIFHKLYILIFW